MKIELAPMEGITSYVYRNALNKYYGGIDTYFTPFISTHKDKELNFKEKKEINPENNKGYKLIPQILTSDADEFLYTSGQIAAFGYDEVNLNFGCPSGTVTTKAKGAGALQDISRLERLLDNIFEKTNLKISIKTRMGYSDVNHFEEILSVYSKYPLTELIIHARIREEFYNGKARLSDLSEYSWTALKETNSQKTASKETPCYVYNGDVYSVSDFENVKRTLPEFSGVMLGRGIISKPWLARDIQNGVETLDVELGTFKAFNHELIDGYDAIMPGEKNTLFKLKELWTYMIKAFDDDKKLLKSVKKTNSLKEYERIIDSL